MGILDLVDFNANVVSLFEDDNIVTVENAEADEFNLSPSINDNFKQLEGACPEWQTDTQTFIPRGSNIINPGISLKTRTAQSVWNCPVCMEEAGSRVDNWRKKGDRQPGVMHVDLAAFEASADGNEYCLVAAVTIEIDKEYKLPIFVPMPKKDLVSALAATKETLNFLIPLQQAQSCGH